MSNEKKELKKNECCDEKERRALTPEELEQVTGGSITIDSNLSTHVPVHTE